MVDLIERHAIAVGDPGQVIHERAAVSGREQVVDGVQVTLTGDAEVGTGSRFTYRFTDAATGKPIDSLRPYLAAAGHVVVMPADASGFAHRHAEVEDDRGRPVFALPGQALGPELGLHADFPRPGVYRLWGQFRAADGRVLTTAFTVEAHEPA
jgi:Cu+-exporting ATPase